MQRILVVVVAVWLLSCGRESQRQEPPPLHAAAAAMPAGRPFVLPPGCEVTFTSAVPPTDFFEYVGDVRCADGCGFGFWKARSADRTILTEMRIAHGAKPSREILDGDPLEYAQVDVFRHLPTGDIAFIAGTFRGLSFTPRCDDFGRIRKILTGYRPAGWPPPN